MDVLEESRYILNKYKIQANKSLGQNFLINDDVINKIIEAANLNENDLVIEIGPGLGVLTNKLLQKAKKVIAIELDEKMIEVITDRFKLFDNFEVINEDILKVNLDEVIKKESNIKNVKVVANLPYYISTPIIIKLLEQKLNIDSIVVMVQKEVADRLTAKPGTRLCGAITYMVDYYTKSKKIVEVDKSCFIPSPKVDSEVIELKIRKEPKVIIDDEKKLFKLIQCGFMQRRKTLSNALINNNYVKNKQDAIDILKKMKLDGNVRGEKLTLEQYAELLHFLN